MTDYIYALLCPQGEIRYIGKTIDPKKRLAQHINAAKTLRTKHHASNWIRSLLASGEKPAMEIIHEVPEGENWEAYEIEAISAFRAEGHRLTNTSPGGKLVEISPEATAKRSRIARASMSGEALREIIRNNAKATWADPVVAERRLAGIRAATLKPGYFERRSIASKKLAQRPGERERRSERGKQNFATSGIAKYRQSREYLERWTDPVLREKRLKNFYENGHMEKLHAGLTAEVIARRAETLRATVSTPEHNAKMSRISSEINSRPEVKAKKSAKSDANWANPEYVAKHAASMGKIRQATQEFLATPEGQAIRVERAAAKRARDIAYGRAKRAERKAAKLAAIAAAPYTESS
jgi:GIY-YIG catalytic domain